MENTGSMDLDIFKNPFDIPRDKLIRQKSQTTISGQGECWLALVAKELMMV
jgi:hypothetical protein